MGLVVELDGGRGVGRSAFHQHEVEPHRRNLAAPAFPFLGRHADHRRHAHLHHHDEAVTDGLLELLAEAPLTGRAQKSLPIVGRLFAAALSSLPGHPLPMPQIDATCQSGGVGSA